jgi:hypothetical protein
MNLPLTRRQLLGGGALLAGGFALAVAWGHRPLTGSGTLEAALDALLPEGAPVAAVAEDIDRFLAAGDPVVAGQLALALRVLEHGCGLVRFSRLDRAARVAVLEGWRSSALGTRRQIADALRRVALFSWYARPETWAAIGYDGPWVKA